MSNNQNRCEMIGKKTTGIPGLDDILMGGLPTGRTTLVSGSSGSGKTILGLQYLVNGIRMNSEPGVFVTCEETPRDIRQNARSFGWDLNAFKGDGTFRFVDLSPVPDRNIELGTEFDLSPLQVRIDYAIEKTQAKRVVIDSVGMLLAQFSDKALMRRELFRICEALKMKGVTTIITAERLEEYGPVARYGLEEFVMDAVVILRNILHDERIRRTLQVLKFRGADHKKGEFPFVFTDQGFEVLTLSSLKLVNESSSARIGSGIKDLDEMCGGGFFRDSVILVSGATGTGKTMLASSFMQEGCKAGEKTLMFSFEESRQQLLRNATGWGKDFREWEEKGLMRIECEYPEAVCLTDHLMKIKRTIEEFKPQRVVVDSLSALERSSTKRTFREFVVFVSSFVKQREITGLFTAVTPGLMGGGSITEQHVSTITDSILILRYVELLGRMHRGVAVLKMRGSQHSKEIRDFRIQEDGMQIGKVFSNVSGIMAGNPSRMIEKEAAELAGMFQE